MSSSRERLGRPTQFHGVPLEERAVDSHGNRLPWALEWVDDYPNARHQKRQPEEKGSFGKSTRRKGSSRATRTQTPAKKENLTLDGFEAALKVSNRDEPHDQQQVGAQGVSDTSIPKPSLTKEPMQLMLYGYSPDNQWAAIHQYEITSGGMICEDYDREPPPERRKYPGGSGYDGHIHPRALTKAEATLARNYSGGSCWIKVTFDSIEAAERAIYNSPHQIHGYWVYAQPYRGQGREPDQPIPVRDEDRQQGLLGGAKPPGRPQTLGASSTSSFQRITSAPKSNITLPRSFAVNNIITEDNQQAAEIVSISSSTASSATALGPEHLQLRGRNGLQRNAQEITSAKPTSTATTPSGPVTFTHFPDTRRTVLRPAAEAFLPQPSWTEKFLKPLSNSGWIPGDVIGAAVPRLENGEFDWNSASFYWKLCCWLDSFFGTDLCGMKES